LTNAGLSYQHAAKLGGLRKPKKDSVNQGWCNESFRGFADYMQTDEFWSALEEVMTYGKDEQTAIMCAEAVPWRCHRSLIADALVTRGCEVRHIRTAAQVELHQLTSFATLTKGVLHYPVPNATSRLF
jgi:uncharacterized protein (DUF488 family)